MTLLEQAMARLRVEYEHAGRTAEFEQLKEYLTAERGAIPYPAIAAARGWAVQRSVRTSWLSADTRGEEILLHASFELPERS